LLHARRAVDAVFDEASLVSCSGLVPVMGLAQQVDLAGLVAARVRPDLSTGSNPGGKAAAVVAGMCAGADSIDDLNVLRHGGMARLFGGVYVNIPARLAHRARRLILHLPTHWPWQQPWQTLFDSVRPPPTTA